LKNDQSMELEILNAAEKLFLKKGFALTSTTMIAKEVGCNQALVHYYFRTKEKLFESVFKNKLMIFFSSFMEIDTQGFSFEEKLRSKIEAHFDVLYENQQLPFLIINELITNPDRISSIKEQFKDKLGTIFHQFTAELEVEIQKGNVRPVSPLDIVFSVLALNVSFFILKPIILETLGLDDDQFNQFAAKRKEENVATILNSLRPQ